MTIVFILQILIIFSLFLYIRGLLPRLKVNNIFYYVWKYGIFICFSVTLINFFIFFINF